MHAPEYGAVAPPSDQDEHSPRRVPAGRETAPVAAPDERVVVLGADWAAASVARERVEQWLRAHRWPPAQIDELVLAVSEAVSNSVEHGYGIESDVIGHPGVVAVTCAVARESDGFRRAVLTIRDDGRWREPGGDAGRGHGLMIMRTCTEECTVQGTATGTTVVLRGRPVPPSPG